MTEEKTCEMKMWDVVLDMGFTSSAGLAREWILGGKVKVDGKVVKDNLKIVPITAKTVVEVKDLTSRVPTERTLVAGDILRKFRQFTF